MKVLLVNTCEIEGGAAKAANRLHKALIDIGVDSYMMVQKKASDDYTVFGPETKSEKIGAAIRPSLDKLAARNYNNDAVFSAAKINSKKLIKKINAFAPDLVHLHWVNDGMMKIEDIAMINAPIVWSLHDMWPFTGGCHYDEHCGRYTEACGKCKVLKSKKNKDLSASVYNRKVKTYSKKQFTIVGLSNWLHNRAMTSSLFKGHAHVCLPNPIDTSVYKPTLKKVARNLWNIPHDKKIILFGAMSATSDLRKGYFFLKDAINTLDVEDVELIVFGGNKPEKGDDFKMKVNYLGLLYDDVSLATLYSMADVMVVPSIQENLSNAIMESLACGTPVVGFDIGGNSDLINHKVNGFLVRKLDAENLTKGIKWVLNNADEEKLSINARESVLENFESKKVAKSYKKLYNSIIRG